MSEREFWHCDPKLYQAYQKQYFDRLSCESYIQGSYNFIAFSRALCNFGIQIGFAKGKLQSYLEKPMNLYGKPKKTKQEVQREYERGRNYQMNWVNALSSNK